MFLKITKLSELLKLQRGLGEAVCRREIVRIMADLNEGPDLDKARVLTFKIEFLPVCDRMANLSEVKVHFSATSKLVTQQSRDLSMRVTDDGQTLLFNDESPDDVQQMSLDQEEETKKKKRQAPGATNAADDKDEDS
jgi:hypothetical protein